MTIFWNHFSCIMMMFDGFHGLGSHPFGSRWCLLSDARTELAAQERELSQTPPTALNS